jgi:hypothetical protein
LSVSAPRRLRLGHGAVKQGDEDYSIVGLADAEGVPDVVDDAHWCDVQSRGSGRMQASATCRHILAHMS